MSEDQPRHRQRTPRGRRIAKIVGIGFLVLVMVVSGVLVWAYKHLEGNINTQSLSGLGKRPTEVKVAGKTQPLNILVMGDDTRKGQGPKIGGTTPGLSDTVILLHVSASRKFAYGVSLPRDAMVERPSCKTGDGTTDPGGLTQFNAAYAIGGPACTVKTVEHLTNVRIDHFVVIKFKAFRSMVDAIGGVTICLPKAVDDNIGHITLPAGTYNATGEQALDYVRERHGIGDGSDIGRIKRQQAFIAALINKVVSAGTLANPIKLYKFLDATTKGLTTDPTFANLKQLVSIGSSLKSIGLSHIKFVTVPWQAYPSDANRIEWAPSASVLWRKIRNDKPLTSAADDGGLVINASDTPGAKSKTKTGKSTTDSGSLKASQAAQAAQYGLCS